MTKTKLFSLSVIALLATLGGYWAVNERTAVEQTAVAQETHSEGDGDNHGAEKEHEGEEGVIHLTPQQVEKAGIKVVEAGPGEVAREVHTTGTVIPDADRVAHVVTRVPGVVAAVDRRIGDQVRAGDLLAVLDSREMADAKSEYLTAVRQENLARTTLNREAGLWKKKVSAEQDYLDARTAAETARITLDAARQRLATLGLSNAEIDALPKQDPRTLSRLEVRAPITGRITSRSATRGELVGAEKEIFTLADLSSVWVEMPVYAADVPLVREGERVVIRGPNGQESTGEVIFMSPGTDPQTGAAQAVAAVDNSNGGWRPGDFASATISTSGEPADIVVPSDALQTLGDETVVFARTEEGFEKRVVEVGRRNSHTAEVVFGLFPSDRIAATNTFVLKAESSRGEAEHSHSH